jgi:hypothetical protein
MNSNLKRRIMAHVYLRYAQSTFLEYPDYFMFGLFVVVSFTMISVHNVITNMPKDNLFSIFNFFLAAVLKTSWIIQMLIIGFFVRTIVAGAMLAYKNLNNRWSMPKPLNFN